PVPEREPLEELQGLQREADRGLAPGHPGVEAVAAQRGRAAVQHPGLAVMAAAAEVGEAHVLVVAAQEDGRDAGALLEVHHGVNDRARVRTAVEVIADADQRVAGRGPEAREQRLELAGTAVDVADREEPAGACVGSTGMLHAVAGRRCSICASSDCIRSAPSRSALLTTKMSAISRSPAFITCTASPASGTRTTTTVSASRMTSSSVCPTPTVSTSTLSTPNASRRRIMSRVARARPPWLPRVERLRMKTPGSRKCACMRMRSPSTAPPLNGLDGSTATMPMRRSAARRCAVRRSVSVDLPAPGGPVTPTTWAWPVRP